jgi:hypothetical protein
MHPISSRISQGLTIAIVLGNVLSGCTLLSPPATPPESSPEAELTPTPSPIVSPSPSPTKRSRLPKVAEAQPSTNPSTITALPPQSEPPRAASPRPPIQAALTPDPNEPDTLRDYGSMSPLPETGRVTLRADIASLNSDRLITDCPTDTALYAFAESSNYRVQICSQEYDPWLPKYYIGRAKDGGDELRLINKNTAEAQQLIFRNGDYMYTLYRDGARPERMNAYLEIYSPDDRKTYAEALVYLYEKSGRP